MSTFSDIVYFPRIFSLGQGVIKQVGDIIERAGIFTKSILLISGSHFSHKVASDVAFSFKSNIRLSTLRIQEASEEAVLAVQEHCHVVRAELIVSVGGGSVIDVGKRVHRLYNIPNIVVPTVISNDGLISPIAVLAGPDKKRRSVPAAMPVGVIVDIEMIRAAPKRYLQAAAGDILSNISASKDWARLCDGPSAVERLNDVAYQLSIGSAESLLNMKIVDLHERSCLENLVRCQIYSGVAMSLAGSSRPCSGAEHLISHAIDELNLGSGVLHGTQVGSIALFVLKLLREDTSLSVEFARKIGIPVDWTKLAPAVAANVEQIIAMARQVRPGRRTILDEFSDEEIVAEAKTFSAECMRV